MAQQNELNDILRSLRPRRIILPILIGLAVVAVIMYREFNLESIESINWGTKSIFLILLAVVCASGRQFAYMWRLRALTERRLNWKKTFQIIAVWEFSSSITPTMVGGTAVGLFMLVKEKIKAGLATTIILVTIFLDSTFFLLASLVLWLFYGNRLISPDFSTGDYTSLFNSTGWSYTVLIAYILMIAYTALVAYGLFVNPRSFKWLLVKLTSLPVIKRWRAGAIKTGDDIIIASAELKTKNWKFWLEGYLATFMAWSTRFGVVICLVAALVGMSDFFLLYGRQLTIYLLLIVTPTPGGAGVADYAFTVFYKDFIPNLGLASAIGTLWRLLTYYAYLILGVIVLPAWVNRIFGSNKVSPQQVEQ